MPKTKRLKVKDVHKPRKKIGNQMKSAYSTHLTVLDPIPDSAIEDPVRWAADHIEKQIPLAAKELEWQLKFGDIKTRREIAIEFLGTKGISSRGSNNTQIVPAIQLILNGATLPWSQPQLEQPKLPVVDGQVVNKETK